MSLFEGIEKDEEGSKEPTASHEPFVQRTLSLISQGEERRTITTGIESNYRFILKNDGSSKDTIEISADLLAAASLGEDAAEWHISMRVKGGKPWEVHKGTLKGKEFKLAGSESMDFVLAVSSPKGARYGDTMNVVVTATSLSNRAISDSITFRTTAQQSVLAIKTQIGHERDVANTLAARSEDLGVQSILCPNALRGYIIVEAMNTDRLAETVRGIKRARGVVDGEMTFDEITHYLTPKPLVSGIVEGDIVELIAGPFKGEKARVQMIDEGKEEITVELFEALVPIPVTVKGDSVRVIEKDR